MGTINPAWRELYPEPLALLLNVIARAHKRSPNAKKQKMGTWGIQRATRAIYRGLELQGYEIQANSRSLSMQWPFVSNGKPALVARKGGQAISIDFARRRPEHRPVIRLAEGEGIRVLVLTESSRYTPWDPADKTSEFHRVSPELMKSVDYLVAAREDPLVALDQAQIAQSYLKREPETAMILQLVKDAWDRGYPLSTHGRVFEYDDQPTRYVPKLLHELHQIHPLMTRKKMIELKKGGYIVHSMIQRNWLKGLKLTEKGAEELAKQTPKPGLEPSTKPAE